MAARVSVTQRKGKIFVIPRSKTIAGFYIEQEPIRTIVDEDWEAVGKAILAALQEYTEGAPVPDYKDKTSLAQKAAGCKSLAQYYRGLRSCSIAVEDKEMIVTPYETLGGRGGMIPISQAEFTAPTTTECQTLGELAREGLLRAKG